MKIISGKIKEAQKVLLYAPEGFGKSTFASHFPDPLYIDVEGSTKQLDVRRFAGVDKWDDVLDAARYVSDNPDTCETLVIDTVDWAEDFCLDFLDKKHGTENILTMDYGRGSLYAVAEFQKLLDILDGIIKKGVNVVMLAHALMRKQELPDEMGAFDRWELKLQSKQVKAKVKEWADMVLFGNYKTIVVEDGETKHKKAKGGKRKLYASHRATHDAKNRHGLPDEMDFEYESIKAAIEGGEDETPPKDDGEGKENITKPKENLSETKEKITKSKPPKDGGKTPKGIVTPGKPPNDKDREIPGEYEAEMAKLYAKEFERDEYKGLPENLLTLMKTYGVTDWDIQNVVGASPGIPYDSEKPIKEYTPGFIEKMLVGKWDKFYRLVLKTREWEEIPFN